MSEFQTYLEAQMRNRFKKGETPIKVPKDYTWSSNAGGFYSYDKDLNSGHVIAIHGPHGNSDPIVMNQDDNRASESINAVLVYKDPEKEDLIENDVFYFYTQKELDDLLTKLEKKYSK